MFQEKRAQRMKARRVSGWRVVMAVIAAVTVQACASATSRPASEDAALPMSAEAMTARMNELSFRMLELSDQMAEKNASPERRQAMLLEMTETAAVLKRMAAGTNAADVNMQLRIEHMRQRIDEMIRQMPAAHARQ